MSAAAYYQIPTDPENAHVKGSHVTGTHYEGGWKPLGYERVNELQKEDEV
jgi:hypothetical protein